MRAVRRLIAVIQRGSRCRPARPVTSGGVAELRQWLHRSVEPRAVAARPASSSSPCVAMLAASACDAAPGPTPQPTTAPSSAIESTAAPQPSPATHPSTRRRARQRRRATRPGLAPGTLAVTVTDDLRVRSAPRVADDSIRHTPLLPNGTELVVTAGPVEANDYTWYRVAPLGFELDDARRPGLGRGRGPRRHAVGRTGRRSDAGLRARVGHRRPDRSVDVGREGTGGRDQPVRARHVRPLRATERARRQGDRVLAVQHRHRPQHGPRRCGRRDGVGDGPRAARGRLGLALEGHVLAGPGAGAPRRCVDRSKATATAVPISSPCASRTWPSRKTATRSSRRTWNVCRARSARASGSSTTSATRTLPATRSTVGWACRRWAGSPRLLTPPDVTGDTRLVLVNAVYFKGEWARAVRGREHRPAHVHHGGRHGDPRPDDGDIRRPGHPDRIRRRVARDGAQLSVTRRAPARDDDRRAGQPARVREAAQRRSAGVRHEGRCQGTNPN